MIVWGGYNGSYLGTGARYNPSTDSWVPTSSSNAPAVRVSHTAVWTGGEMVVWGGYGGDAGECGGAFSDQNGGGRYDPSTDSWIPTSIPPGGGAYHTAVWTGSEMIVWGGLNGPCDLNIGGRYVPSTDSWVATSTLNVPSARQSHTAIWTGSEMIIWGGTLRGPGNVLNNGGRYNPTTDNWVATTTTNAPAARYNHTVVWTGSKMIVWGGWDDTNSFNTGGRYDPNGDSWDATTSTNAPSVRRNHTAVWTGSEMIVWGGSYNGNALNSGGRYNPNSDNWVATSINNAPASRSSHTAVWTGSQMIIWGGSGALNTGGRYSPTADSWVATSTSNAPAGRSSNLAMWTGTEMIIWGGCCDGAGDPLNTGGRYKPNPESWVSTNTTGAPRGGWGNSAVWTGTEMIIWGGELYNSLWFNSGGRYCAQPSAPIVQTAKSRKTHGSITNFDVDLPLSGSAGIECRGGGATSDYSIVVTFLANVSIAGTPQAQVTSGAAAIGSNGMSNGGIVTISGNVVTIPLTNVANGQTISVTLNLVNGSTDVTIPMSILVGDVNGNGSVNASDVAAAKSRIGQPVDGMNFRSDVNTNGVINASDIAIVKSVVGSGLP